MFDWSQSDLIVLPISLGVIIVISILLGVLFKNKSAQARSIPLMVIAATILVLEAIKQVKGIAEGYGFWTFPLHFCSLFLYFFPLACFAKGKVQNFGKTMSFVCSTLLFVMFYFNPGTIIGAETTANIFESFSSFHTFIYHHLAILFLPLSLALRFYNFDKKCYLHVLIGFTLYAVIMIPCAYLMDTNFCNILESNIPFMESLRLQVGQVAYTIIMYLISIIGGVAIVSIPLLINKLFKSKKEGRI